MDTVGIVSAQEPWQLIINLAPSGGRAEAKREEILGHLQRRENSYEAHVTQGA